MNKCCQHSDKYKDAYYWFKIEDEDLYVMPCIIGVNGEKLRVNYCPECGKYIRDIKLNSKEIFRDEIRKEDILDKHLIETDLPYRLTNIICANKDKLGIKINNNYPAIRSVKVRDIIEIDINELRRMRNCGNKSIEQFKKFLKSHNLIKE